MDPGSLPYLLLLLLLSYDSCCASYASSSYAFLYLLMPSSLTLFIPTYFYLCILLPSSVTLLISLLPLLPIYTPLSFRIQNSESRNRGIQIEELKIEKSKN
ncbi:hypothetical protein BZA77DRAFT_318846 [Pyronema omphalodes]|nr:hypothetical protein BZA77DRAFT_318846 [Pyronema omphalodes]